MLSIDLIMSSSTAVSYDIATVKHLNVTDCLARWEAVLQTVHAHISQLWTMPIAIDTQWHDIHSHWIHHFVALNEEQKNPTGIPASLTDLLFTIRCYILVIQHAAQSSSTSSSSSTWLQECKGVRAIRDVITDVKLLGMRNTPASRSHYATPDDVRALELKVATLVVFELGRGETTLSLDAKDDMAAAALTQQTTTTTTTNEGLQREARVRDVRCSDFKPPVKQALEDGQLPSDKAAPPGTIWLGLDSNTAAAFTHTVKTFVGFSSRVFHKIHFDAWILSRMRPRVLDANTVHDVMESAFKQEALFTWLKSRSRMQVTNEFTIDFQKLAFEEALPMEALYGGVARHSARSNRVTSASSLLDQECGFHALNRVNTLTMEPMEKIAGDQKHELHRLLLLFMFSYEMRQSVNVPFLETFCVTNQRTQSSKTLQEFFAKPIKWGQNQRPMLVELERRWCVLDVVGVERRSAPVNNNNSMEEDSNDKTVVTVEDEAPYHEFVPCGELYQALVYWVHLMRVKYNDKLLCMSSLKTFHGKTGCC